MIYVAIMNAYIVLFNYVFHFQWFLALPFSYSIACNKLMHFRPVSNLSMLRIRSFSLQHSLSNQSLFLPSSKYFLLAASVFISPVLEDSLTPEFLSHATLASVFCSHRPRDHIVEVINSIEVEISKIWPKN